MGTGGLKKIEKKVHNKAKRGSGGVGVFVKNSLLKNYSLVTDKSMEDVIWLKFSDRQS